MMLIFHFHFMLFCDVIIFVMLIPPQLLLVIFTSDDEIKSVLQVLNEAIDLLNAD